MKKPYVGVPAPEVLEDDPWFGPAPLTEKRIAIQEAEAAYEEAKKLGLLIEEEPESKESEDIHQVMYEMATKNVATTLALDPMPSLGGGSENFQEGWMSGAGPHFS